MDIIWWDAESSLQLEPSLEGVTIDGSIPELVKLRPEGLSLVWSQVDLLWVHVKFTLLHIELFFCDLGLEEDDKLELESPGVVLLVLLVLIVPSSVLAWWNSIEFSIACLHNWSASVRSETPGEVSGSYSVGVVWPIPGLDDVLEVSALEIDVTREVLRKLN